MRCAPRLARRSGGCAACRCHRAESVRAPEAAGATRRFPCCSTLCGEIKQAQRQSALCHPQPQPFARARRWYGADQHHQPRHTACATLLLLRVPSAAAASVCCVLSVRCGGCSLGPLSVDCLCACVPASLSESVSARTATCMHERNRVSRRFIRAATIGAPRRLLSPPPLLPAVPELPTNLKRSGMLRRAAEQLQQQLPGSCPPVPASAQHPMQPSSSSLPQAH